MISAQVQLVLQGIAGVGGLILAQAPSLGPWESLTTTCVCGALLGWTLMKTIPALSKDHRAACKDLACSIDQQTEAMRERDAKLIDLLQKNIGDK